MNKYSKVLFDFLFQFKPRMIQLDYSVKYSVERLTYFHDELMKLSKFKLGDIVELTDTPDFDVCHGWGSYSNIIFKGSVCKIVSVEHYDGSFRYMVEFNSVPRQFCFKESELRLSDNKCKTCGKAL